MSLSSSDATVSESVTSTRSRQEKGKVGSPISILTLKVESDMTGCQSEIRRGEVSSEARLGIRVRNANRDFGRRGLY